MITILSAPIANRILLDGNNTVISIVSVNGANHYFRSEIYIDDVLFDEQGWSRKDGFTAEKDLKKLYNDYFKTVFEESFITGLTEQIHLKKKVLIKIKEYNLATDVQSAEIDLPVFYILYNQKPTAFDDEKKVQFLGLDADVYQVPKSGKISMPFIANCDNESATVTIKSNLGTVINTVSSGVFTGKKIFLYNFDLGQYNFEPNTLFLRAEITVGTITVFKNYRIMSLPDYSIKELAFLNNFGFYTYAYLDGQMTIDSNLDIDSYQEQDSTDKIFEINETKTYTINSGSLLTSEKELLSQIANALRSKLKIGSDWLDIVGTTKKVNRFKDRNNLYSENLTFSVKPKSIENTGMAQPPTGLILSHVSTMNGLIKFKVEYLSGTPGSQLISFAQSATENWIDLPNIIVESGEYFISLNNIFVGTICNFMVKLEMETVYSNIVTLSL